MLGRKTTLVIANTLVGGILGYAALKVIALYMGAGVYGQLAFAIGLMGTVSFLTDLGFYRAHLKRVSEGQDVGDCIVTYGALSFVMAGTYMALVFLALTVNRVFLHRPFVSTTETAVVLIAAYNAALIIRKVGGGTFYALRENARSELVVLSEHLVRVPATILFALFYASAKGRQGPIFDLLRDVSPGFARFVFAHGADFLAVAMLAAAATSAAVSLIVVAKKHPLGEFDMDLLRKYAAFAAPVMVASAVTSVSTYIDKAAIGFFWTEAEAGRYYGVQRLLAFLSVVQNAVGTMLFPAMSEQHASGNHDRLRSLISRSLRHLSMLLVPAAFGLTVLARPSIRILLSNEWLGADVILSILAFTTVIQGFTTPFGSSIWGSDRPKTMASINILRALLTVGLTMVLVPSALFGVPLFGLRGEGAALALLAASVVTVALQVRAAEARPGLDLVPRLAKHWIAGLGMALVLWWLQLNVFPVVRWFHLLAYVGLGAGIYYALLVVLGEFKREDWEFYRQSLHPAKMARYIRRELFGEE